MKKVQFWDPRFPDRSPLAAVVSNAVASAIAADGTGVVLPEVVLGIARIGGDAGLITLAPVNTAAPAITGIAQEGQTLSASDGGWSNAPTGFAYQWRRNGAAIAGSTFATRLLTAADVGAVLDCVVTASNAGGSASAASGVTAAITAASIALPANTTAPVVSGAGTIGQALTTTNGVWSGSPTGYAYQWRRDGVNIGGATAASYTLVSADAGASVTCRVFATNAGGTAGATSNAIAVAGAGFTPATLAAVPSARWGANLNAATVDGGNRVTSVPDYTGASNPLIPSFADTGAIQMTDSEGRKFWRFNRYQAMKFESLAIDNRNMAVFLVMKNHRARGASDPFFSLGTANGAANTNGPALAALSSGGIAPRPRSGAAAVTTAANANKLIVGCNLQIVAACLGATSALTELYVNEQRSTATGTAPTAITLTGGTVGAYAHTVTAAALTGATAAGAGMDLYEIVIYAGRPTQAQADAIVAALMSSYGIIPTVNAATVEGDSIEQGFFPAIESGDGPVMQMDIPAGWRVVNTAASGNTTTDLVARRDTADSMHAATSMLGGGKDVLLFQIGVNDMGSTAGSRTGANIYNESGVDNSIVSLIAKPTTGYLPRGYDRIFVAVNIATTSAATMTQINALRALLRNVSQFRADTGATSSNLNIIDLPAITRANGDTLFNTAADAARNETNNPTDAIYKDALHPTGAAQNGKPGNKYMAKGGAWDQGAGVGFNACFLA